MSKPDDIPQDIWDEAYRWAEDGGTIYRNIARAILNERNNAADRLLALIDTPEIGGVYIAPGGFEVISQAIRNGGK
jgi:hypothetical protein